MTAEIEESKWPKCGWNRRHPAFRRITETEEGHASGVVVRENDNIDGESGECAFRLSEA